MADPIGPGDFVECVDATWRGTGVRRDTRLIVVGRVYRVARVSTIGGLLLSGGQSANPLGYWADRFRPIYRPKASLIEGLKRPISTPEKEVV